MSNLDVRNNSAMMKRAEQLKRWEESDTNRAAPVPRNEPGRRIKFSSGCVFLAACLSGDKEEVIQLIDQGADINTANVDGLTALHQACIDDNLDMVEFLVEHGADINRQDNEGWTPLHATASCGFVSIARYLVENHADVAAVNSDGDLALDLAIDVQHMPMIDYMEKVVQELSIDVEAARKAEEMAMLNDAKKWLRSDAAEMDKPHPKTGATALHVAAAKGYKKVLSLLLAGRGNVDRQDNDGWTPLHAASHWGQKETAEMLVESLADMDIRNYAGQSCIDVADRKMVKFLEELRANNKRNKRRPSSQISRISDAIENHVEKTPTKLVRVEVRNDAVQDVENIRANKQIHEHAVEEEAPWRRKTPRTPNDSPTKNQVPDKELNSKSANESANDVILRRTQSFENDQKKPIAPAAMPTATTTNTTTTISSPSTTVLTPPIRRSFVPPVRDEESETQRKAHAKRNETSNTTATTTSTTTAAANNLEATEALPPPPPTTPPPALNAVVDDDEETQIIELKSDNDTSASFTLTTRRTLDFESEAAAADAACNDIDASASYTIVSRREKPSEDKKTEPVAKQTSQEIETTQQSRPKDLPLIESKAAALATPATTPGTLDSPVRLRDKRSLSSNAAAECDAKSDTASPVSTVGDFNARDSLLSLYARRTMDTATATATAAAAAGGASSTAVLAGGAAAAAASTSSTSAAERRPSWRLKIDAGSKFKLEDITSGGSYPPNQSTIIPSAPAVMAAANLSNTPGVPRRISTGPNALNASNQSLNSLGRPVSAPSESLNNSAYVTPPARKYDTSSSNSQATSTATATTAATTTASSANHATASSAATNNQDDKGKSNMRLHHSINKSNQLYLWPIDNDKENDNRTQTVIQRRRKPKRRSTGVVHLDMDELDPERQNESSNNDNEDKDKEFLGKYDRLASMSFRSRSRAQAPLGSHRRSLSSSSRVGGATAGGSSSSSAGYNYNGSSYNSRPLSTGYFGSSSNSGGGYQSPYTSIYSSRESLYGGGGGGSSSLGGRGSYYTNGNASNRFDYAKYQHQHQHHQLYQQSTANSTSSSSSLGATTKLHQRNASSYYQPTTSSSSSSNNHANHYHFVISAKHCSSSSNSSSNSSSCSSYANSKNSATLSNNYNTQGGAAGGGYDSGSRYAGYTGSAYGNEHRYVSPYTSSYDNGVTTASLSFKSPSLSASNSFKGSSASSRLLKTKSLSGSNSSLNVAASAGATVAAIAATRSNSLREQERKSRNRTRSRSAAQRSISASSEKSEGYESGSERTSRSRTGSTATTSDAKTTSSSSSSKTENGDGIDYKALWEAAKMENDKLKQMLKQKDDEVVQTRATLERFANAQLDVYKSDNHRLKEENAALIRVISKLSK
ncbi:Mbs [Drosophila busckii]|uniref:Protein phosphatase 1 regulatory subunit 12B n=1 Tax=Drosophila busckii TaxID=30019 RepID=A0A0M4ECR6_DROBS|nr:Mbs [Drosophila busckii]